jgi:ribonuclease Z
VSAARLDHGSQTFGYRIQEHSSRTVHPGLLPPEVSGRRIGELKREGSIRTERGVLWLEEVSSVKPGQCFVCLLDTRLCQGAEDLARDATLLVSEATYLESEAELARDYRHLTAAQAAGLASRAGVGKVILVHYSQRYKSLAPFAREAKAHHPDVIAARDGDVIPLPRLERKGGDRICPDSAQARGQGT